MSLPIAIVAVLPEHRPFLFSSWIAEVRRDLRAGRCDANWLAVAQHALIERLLAAPSVLCAVAVNPADHDQIYGYLVGEPGPRVLHWIYTRGRFRRAGVATRLMERVYGARVGAIEVTWDNRRLDWLRERYELPVRTHRLCEALPHVA